MKLIKLKGSLIALMVLVVAVAVQAAVQTASPVEMAEAIQTHLGSLPQGDVPSLMQALNQPDLENNVAAITLMGALSGTKENYVAVARSVGSAETEQNPALGKESRVILQRWFTAVQANENAKKGLAATHEFLAKEAGMDPETMFDGRTGHSTVAADETTSKASAPHLKKKRDSGPASKTAEPVASVEPAGPDATQSMFGSAFDQFAPTLNGAKDTAMGFFGGFGGIIEKMTNQVKEGVKAKDKPEGGIAATATLMARRATDVTHVAAPVFGEFAISSMEAGIRRTVKLVQGGARIARTAIDGRKDED